MGSRWGGTADIPAAASCQSGSSGRWCISGLSMAAPAGIFGKERGEMKIVVVRSPRALRGVLRTLFGLR